jgi:hypothetical protein
MLRALGDGGWWLIRHPDHAQLAGEFAARWGNERFRSPHPHADVLEGIRSHDDGWAERDRAPLLTREGRPSAFGVDLVGRYTAFEEIDLPDYLAVRGRAMEGVAQRNAYAAILISMHTCNLLTEHADRSTIRPDQLALLDGFVAGQRLRQLELRGACADTGRYADADLAMETLTEHFRLLQACDNLSLLSCVDFEGAATLLHPLPLRDGGISTVNVMRMGPRRFRLDPWPFDIGQLEFEIPAKWVDGVVFDRVEEIRERYAAAATEWIRVELVRE